MVAEKRASQQHLAQAHAGILRCHLPLQLDAGAYRWLRDEIGLSKSQVDQAVDLLLVRGEATAEPHLTHLWVEATAAAVGSVV